MKKLLGTLTVGIILWALAVGPPMMTDNHKAQAQNKSNPRARKSRPQAKSKAKASRSDASSFDAAYQASRDPKAKSIDVVAKKLQESFIRQAAELARDYEDAGDLEMSKKMLEAILKVKSDVKGVREKIEQIENNILSSNEFDFEIDTGKSWGEPVGRVFQGKSLRIQVSGKYKFVTNVSVGPDGFPTEDPTKEMARDVPCGAVMGLVLDAKRNPGRPFRIGASEEVTPRSDGTLFLSVNAPPGHKCTGKLKVKLSGYIGKPN